MRCLGAFKKQHPEAKKIYLFIVDHVFGWGQQAYVESLAPNYGLEVVGVDRHPLGHREFSSYIIKAMSTNPDAIYMVNFGLDAISAARQIYNFGFTPKKTVIMSWSAGFEEMVQLSPEGRENMIVGTNFYYQIDTPVAKDFVKKYKAQSKDNQPPGYAPGAAYAMTRIVLAGIRKAGSGKVQDVVKALEGYEGEDLVGSLPCGSTQSPDDPALLHLEGQEEERNEARFRFRDDHRRQLDAATTCNQRVQGYREALTRSIHGEPWRSGCGPTDCIRFC